MTINGQDTHQTHPLAGIKVVEYGVFHAGPGGGAILGDLGADIVKIEAFGGDPERYWTSIGGINIASKNGESLMHEVSNRNKRGVCVDIKQPAGRRILEKLVEQADIFLTNLRQSTKATLEIDYPPIARINPRIIHASVSGYGRQGPLADIGAFDPLGQACSGMMFVTGSDHPAPLQIGILDQTTAIALSHAIITALYVRERTGEGQAVDVSLYSTALWMQHANMMLANVLSIDPCLTRDRRLHSPLRNTFRCRDDRWLMGVHHPEEKYWKTFCRSTGQAQLFDDPEFTNDQGQPQQYARLTEIFDSVFAGRTQDEWMAIFQTEKLMFIPIRRINDVKDDLQAQVNGYVVSHQYSDLGEVAIPGYPAHFSRCQAGFQRRAPKKGEHTAEVLSELGYSELEIQQLTADGIVA
jgi:crotonobetainyl-CoA:carnitine CoA-transferase CaiB-like acyl-CoA transferase